MSYYLDFGCVGSVVYSKTRRRHQALFSLSETQDTECVTINKIVKLRTLKKSEKLFEETYEKSSF